MDKIIEAEVTTRKTRNGVLIAVIAVLLLTGSIFLLRSSLATEIKKSAITTAVVERGNIENTINATGEILPEFEEVITSPINASVQQVLLDAGIAVKAGQSVISLDKSASQTEFEKLKFGLESKQNDIRKLRLQLDKGFYDIKSNNSIKELRINSLQADVENARRLYKAGGGTREDVEKAELNLKVANLEKQQLENEIRSKQQTMEVEMREAAIAASIQENDLRELERKLKLANIVASRDGVITWINKNIGAAVHEGDALARIADLSSFKVIGSIAESYLDQLRNGMTAIIRVNEEQVRGTVVNIQPAVQNSTVSFNIQLDERNNKLLRPNMKVDVFLVTSAKTDVLRVANGAAFKGSSTQDIFVLDKGKARRVTVHTGMTNFDYVEIKDQLKPGDVVITSDLSEYRNAKEIIINN
jgi:HlyD family secretion protein